MKQNFPHFSWQATITELHTYLTTARHFEGNVITYGKSWWKNCSNKMMPES